jgi:hypothetical protein
MRKLLLLVGLTSLAMLVTASAAIASPNLTCTGTVVGGTYHDVTVPDNAACSLIGTTVENNVNVRHFAYFEASGTTVGHDVNGDRATTVYVHDGSVVGHNLQATHGTQQLLAFDSTVVNGLIRADSVPKAYGTVDICGMTVQNGNIQVTNSGSDILVGDPLTTDCAGNAVQSGDVKIQHNQTDVELIIRGNTIQHDMIVTDNKGPSDKAVEANTGGHRLDCHGNQLPFTASANSGWAEKKGQCAGP